MPEYPLEPPFADVWRIEQSVFILGLWSECFLKSNSQQFRLFYFYVQFKIFFLYLELFISLSFFYSDHGLFYFIYLFGLHWVFIVARGLSLVAASGGYSSLRCEGFSLRWLLLLRSTGSRHVGFSSCGSRASVLVARRLQYLWLAGSRAQAQQLWRTSLVAPRHVGSSRTRPRTRVPCIGRRVLNHCATREVPGQAIFSLFCQFIMTCVEFLPPVSTNYNLPYTLFSTFCHSFALPRYVGSFLPFGTSEVFCQHSVGVLQELFHMQMYFWCICGEEGDLHVLLLRHLEGLSLSLF